MHQLRRRAVQFAEETSERGNSGTRRGKVRG